MDSSQNLTNMSGGNVEVATAGHSSRSYTITLNAAHNYKRYCSHWNVRPPLHRIRTRTTHTKSLTENWSRAVDLVCSGVLLEVGSDSYEQ